MAINWVASYPKSGNTWVRSLIAQLLEPGSTINDLNRLIPYAEAPKPYTQIARRPLEGLTHQDCHLLRPSVHAILPGWGKTHAALFKEGAIWHVNPENIGRAVYIIRDPRDVVVSYAYHTGRTHEDVAGSMSRDTASTIKGPIWTRLLNWSRHVQSWAAEDLADRVMVVRYEDLYATPRFTIGQMASHFDISCPKTHRHYQDVVEACSFEKLRAQEEEQGFHEAVSLGDTERRRFFRRGKPGSWYDELAPDLARKIEFDHAEVMERFEYL